MNDLVRVKLENGMEASLPRDHAINSGYTPLDKPGADTLGNPLPPSKPDEKLLAKRESQLAALNKTTKTAAASGQSA